MRGASTRLAGPLIALATLLCVSGARAQEGTACCLAMGGCVDDVLPGECTGMDGQPFGACATCDEIDCPLPACIGATGSCEGPFTTPGCDSLTCCTVVCETRPECCADDFPADCGITDCEKPMERFACCLPGGSCILADGRECYDMGGISDLALTECPGDLNGDGLDDSCGCSGGDVPALSGWKPLALLTALLLAPSALRAARRTRSANSR
jgi:hypothetical protein